MTDLLQNTALVQRIAEEDESALRELYAAYGQRMYAYALRLTGGIPAMAEDVVQDTLVAAGHRPSHCDEILATQSPADHR